MAASAQEQADTGHKRDSEHGWQKETDEKLWGSGPIGQQVLQES